MSRTIRYSSDEDNTYDKWRTKTIILDQLRLRHTDVGNFIVGEKMMQLLTPFVYEKLSPNVSLTNVKIKALAETPIPILLWESPDGINLLKTLHNTAEEMKFITNSAGYILYLVDDIRNEIYICNKNLEEVNGRRYSWAIDREKTIAVYVAKEKKAIIRNDSLIDARFPEGQDLGDFFASNILTIPVKDDSTCVAVIELYRVDGVSYDENDMDMTTYLAELAGDVIAGNKNIVGMRMENEINDILLEYTVTTLPIQTSQEGEFGYAQHLVNYASNLLNSSSVTFFSLKDNGLLKVMGTNKGNPALKLNPHKKKLRIAKEIEIADIIKNSRSIVNFADVFNDPRFDKSVDRHIGLLIRSVLGCGINKKNGQHFGVLMAINKQTDHKYTPTDEMIIETFAKYLTIGLEYMSEVINHSEQRRTNNALEGVLIHQLSKRLKTPEVFSWEETVYIPNEFHEYTFVPDDPELLEIPKYIYYIFNSLLPKLVPNKNNLYTLIFAAKKIYREENRFHNFHHAFKCVHDMYLILKQHPEVFDDNIEKYAMLMAALLHDCDHRGLSIKYLELVSHPMINRSLSTPLEAYHYQLGKLILKYSKVLEQFDAEELVVFGRVFKESVMGSNLSLYMKTYTKIKNLLETDEFDWHNEDHRGLVRGIAIVSTDFAGFAKPLEHTYNLSYALYAEYFAEGEKIKELGLKPPPILDNDTYNEIPTREATFCSAVVLPCYEILMKILPNTTPLYLNSTKALKMWTQVADGTQTVLPNQSEDILSQIVGDSSSTSTN